MDLSAWNSIIGSIAALKRDCAQFAASRTVSASRTLARAVSDASVAPRTDGTALARAAAREPIAPSPELVLRNGALTRLEELRRSLGLRQEEATQYLFPLTIYFDQLIQEAAAGAFDERSSLQRALFDIDDGGEQFYATLDRVLRERSVPLLSELYYFILKDGFLGRYEIDHPERTAYLHALSACIEENAPRVHFEPAGPLVRTEVPARSYGRAAAVVAATVVVLWCASELEVRLEPMAPMVSGKATMQACGTHESRR